MAHRTEIAVRFAELDPYAHVNHAVYVTYFEVARSEALASVGAPLHLMAEEGFQFVVTDIQVSFKRAAVAGELLVVETEVSEVRRASTVWSQRILRDDEVMVTGTIRAAVTDTKGRPTRPPAWLFEMLGPLVSASAS